MTRIGLCVPNPSFAPGLLEILNENPLFPYALESVEPDPKKCRNFRLCIVDITEDSGFRLAQKLRSGGISDVILISDSGRHAMEAFDMDAVGYLKYPVDPLRLAGLIIRYFSVQPPGSDYPFLFRTASGVRALPVNEIAFVEYSDHRLIVHRAFGGNISTTTIRTPFLKAAEALLRDPRFLRTHESFIVNIMHISQFTAASLTMTNNEAVPISSSRKGEVRDYLTNYFNERFVPTLHDR